MNKVYALLNKKRQRADQHYMKIERERESVQHQEAGRKQNVYVDLTSAVLLKVQHMPNSRSECTVKTVKSVLKNIDSAHI